MPLCLVLESQFSVQAGRSGGRNVAELLRRSSLPIGRSVLTGPSTVKPCGAQITDSRGPSVYHFVLFNKEANSS